MRLFEMILVAGAALLVAGWAMGWRARRAVPLFLVALTGIQIVVEGQRLAMWPVYAILLVAAVAATVRLKRQPPRRSGWRQVLRWVAAAILLLTAIPLPSLWPVMRLPTPAGRYGIGQGWMVVVDSSRRERFATKPGAIRRFPVKIWYPAPAGTTGPRAPYGEPREFAGAGMPPFLFSHVGLIRTNAILGAPLATGDRFPILIFSHGYGGGFGQNTVQMEELASQGYVIASIAHPGEAGWAPFPDGTGMGMDTGIVNMMRRQAAEPDGMKKALAAIARFDSVKTPEAGLAELRRFIAEGPEPLRSESVAEWAADTRALVDLLATFDHGGASSPFHGRLDLGRLGVFGMSYGGATAGDFCRQDDRCQAALNMDGGQYGGLINDSLRVPFLIMASSQAYSVHVPVLELTRGPAYLIKVPETNHIGLTDLSLFAPVAFRAAGITGKLDPERRERIMTAYVLAFFDTYLRNTHSPLLDGPSTEFPEFSIVRRHVP